MAQFSTAPGEGDKHQMDGSSHQGNTCSKHEHQSATLQANCNQTPRAKIFTKTWYSSIMAWLGEGDAHYYNETLQSWFLFSSTMFIAGRTFLETGEHATKAIAVAMACRPHFGFCRITDRWMINALFVHKSMFVYVSLHYMNSETCSKQGQIRLTICPVRGRGLFTCFILTERITFVTENYMILHG